MKANPGGQIDLKEVVGRDVVIGEIRNVIEQQSARLNAERRIGKTTIIKKLYHELQADWITIFQDLEQYHTALQFSTSVFREVEKHLSRSKRTALNARKLLESLGGMEVGGVFKLPEFTNNVPWKDILSSCIHDIVEESEKINKRPLFLWDEVPFMLENIKQREGEHVAMEVLDSLRGLRQTYETRGLRMIITGSIGLHHVIKSLKQYNYANAPMNDVLAIKILPLEFKSAQELSSKLITGEKIKTPLIKETVIAIAKISDGFPFYIHHIIKAMKLSAQEGSPELVELIVKKQLLDADDPWELNHYRERISTYYGKENEKAVLAILDSLALREEAISLNDLLTELKATGELDDRELLISLLKTIEQDHYLTRNMDGLYYFQFPLLQRWWKLSRGL
ncbi:MAG: hypothetical protein QM479_15385 [Pseudomonadota bacterium]